MRTAPSRSKQLALVLDAWRATRAGQGAIQDRQQTRLANLVRFARQHSPFYRALYAHLPEEVDDLAWLPPVTKPQLMASFDEVATDPAVTQASVGAFMADWSLIGQRFLGRYAVWTSSGITGVQGTFVHDARALALYRVLTFWRGWLPRVVPERLWATIRQGNRVAMVVASGGHLGGASLAAAARRDHPWPFNQIRQFSARDPLPKLVEALNGFQPAQLIAYPSALAILAQEQLDGRLTIRPAVVACGGEWLAPAARRLIEAAFACPLRQNYGACEFPALAWDCGHGRLHLSADWAILEPVDAAYRPVPPGQESHTVLLTNLVNRVQPLIRYELGDRVTLPLDPCQCGSSLPVVEVEGRREEILTFSAPDGRRVPLLPLALVAAVIRVPGLKRYQLIQTDPSTLSIRFEAQVGSERQAVWRTLDRELRAFLQAHGLPQVEVVAAPDLPRPEPVSGKFRKIWSELARSQLHVGA